MRRTILVLLLALVACVSATVVNAQTLSCKIKSTPWPWGKWPWTSSGGLTDGIEKVDRIVIDLKQQTILLRVTGAVSDAGNSKRDFFFHDSLYGNRNCSFTVRETKQRDKPDKRGNIMATLNCGSGDLFYYEPDKNRFQYVVLTSGGLQAFVWDCFE